MPRAKKPPARPAPTSAPTSPRERGLRAFQSGRLDQAIALWAPLASSDPAVRTALAEAHFRRALAPGSPHALDDIRRAAEFAPHDLRYRFHLGRLQHQAGEHAAAEAAYRAVLAAEPGHVEAARLLALLTLERHPYAQLQGMPGLTPEALAWAAPAQAVIRGQVPTTDESPLGRLWRGLGRLATRDPSALPMLADERQLPAPALHGLRRYYRGLAAALAGDSEQALRLWQQLFSMGEKPGRLEQNLAALVHERLAAAYESGDLPAAAALARNWAALADGPAFDELRVLVLDRSAHAAAATGNWDRAAADWEAAREILGRGQGLGSPQPILHNLALAYERLEEWEPAAESWRALLRTRPRKRSAEDAAAEARWAWVRKRIIECYRRAGRPDEAVTVFRQALKAEPNDLELRIQLADALMANQQERAATNELQRILQIDPQHPEALLRMAIAQSERGFYAEAEEIARGLVERHPDRDDLRRAAAGIFLHNGRQHAESMRYDAAYRAFVEGERYDPSNPRFPINQARMLILQRRSGDTAGLVERALNAAGDRAETWTIALETWQMAGDEVAARALLERFARERQPAAEDYVAMGTALMLRALPQPAMPLALFGPLAPPRPTDTPWTRLAMELLERAVAIEPDEPRIKQAIASFLMLPRPDLARPFAEAAVAQLPDDPQALILLGLVLGLGDQVQEAKATLQRAAQLARHQGNRDLQEQAQEIRRVVGTPMLRLMLQSGLSDPDLLDELDEEFFQD